MQIQASLKPGWLVFHPQCPDFERIFRGKFCKQLTFSHINLFFVSVCVLAYSCMRKLFAPHAAGPVVCLKSAVETAGLGFQAMLQPQRVCVWVVTASGVTVV